MLLCKISQPLGRVALIVTTMLLAFIKPVQAQGVGINFNPPDVKLVDEVGVNYISGLVEVTNTPVAIGPGKGSLALHFRSGGGAIRFHTAFSHFYGQVYRSKVLGRSEAENVDEITVSMFGSADTFMRTGGSWVSSRRNGSQLQLQTDGSFVYTGRMGERYYSDPAIRTWSCDYTGQYECQVITRVIYPDGLELRVAYAGPLGSPIIRSATRSDGLQIRYVHGANDDLVEARAVNSSVEYCDPAANACSYAQPWPRALFSRTYTPTDSVSGSFTEKVVDAANLETTFDQSYNGANNRIVAVRSPSGGGASNIEYMYRNQLYCDFTEPGSQAWDCSVSRYFLAREARMGTAVWTYKYDQVAPYVPAYSGAQHQWKTTASTNSGAYSVASYSVFSGTVYSVSSSVAGDLAYGGYNRVDSATDSEGRSYGYLYDDRGNITSKSQLALPGSGQANLVVSAGYDLHCNQAAKCNKPNWVRDATGQQTDYVYDGVHGGVLSETLPPDDRNIRPMKRYSYMQRAAWTRNASGGYSPSPAIWVLERMSYCRNSAWNGAACAANDEVTTTYDYGPDSGPNNLWLRGQLVSAGGQSLLSCTVYDALGNKIRETTPGAGLGACP